MQIKITNGDVVILSARDEINPSSESLDVCALRKPYAPNADSDRQQRFSVVNFAQTLYDGCTTCPRSLGASSAAYLQITASGDCPFDTLTNNLEREKPGLVVIGSDGPFVSCLSARHFLPCLSCKRAFANVY